MSFQIEEKSSPGSHLGVNMNGAGYFKIKNTGTTDIQLLEVVSDSVDNIEIHKEINKQKM